MRLRKASLQFILILVSLCAGLNAADPGLPFTEDFSADTLKDTATTRANWSTDEQKVYLAWKRQIFKVFDGTALGAGIGTDTDNSRMIQLGDLDGDGDLDVVVANNGMNKYYLNDGDSDPFDSIVSGSDLGTDSDNTRSIQIGDIDGDGDLDVVAGNTGVENKYYLNDGDADPFDSVGAGTAIGTDTDTTYSICLGDLDGDGDLDVVSGNAGQNNKYYLNDGDGAPFDSVAGGSSIGIDVANTVFITLGDLDGDNDLDVIVADWSATNKYYLNDGDANPFDTAGAGIDIGTDTDDTVAVQVGDIDGDGDLDVVTANDSGNTNKYYLNDGDSNPFDSVGAGTAIGTDIDGTYSIQLADVDTDGDLDVVTGNIVATNKLYLNDGDAAPFDSVGNGKAIGGESDTTYYLQIGDVDNDGDLDIVTAENGVTNKYYSNIGSASPFADVTAGTDVGTDADDTYSISIADIDGDGDLDVISGNLGATNKYYPNDGDSDPFSGVGAGTDIGTDTDDTTSIVAADIDGDGDLDVIAGNSGQTNKYYVNDGDSDPFSGVGAGTDIGTDTDTTCSIAIADLDGDGDLDVAAGNDGQTNKYYVNDGDSAPFNGIGAGTDIGTDTDTTFSIQLADLDGDGDLDVITGNSGVTNKYYLNDGDASPFNTIGAGTAIGTDTDTTRSISVVDLDGDNDLDVVSGNVGQTNKYYSNDGDTNPFDAIGAGTAIGTDTDDTWSLMIIDIDGDGDLDVVSGNYAQEDKFYLNDGDSAPFTGITAGTDIGTDTANTRTIAAVDIDGDGDSDVVSGISGTNTYCKSGRGYSKYTNQVSGRDIGTYTGNVYAIQLGDIDGDGDLDVVTGSISGGGNRYFLNDGDDTPFDSAGTGTVIGIGTNSCRSLKLGDIDGDGDLDLVVGNADPGDKTNLYFLNDGDATPFDTAGTGESIGLDLDNTWSIQLGDIDGDGDLDVVAGNAGATNKYYLNDGDSDPFNAVIKGDIGTDEMNTYSIRLGDIDADGDLDVVTGDSGTTNKYYLNDGDSDPFDSVGAGSDIGTDTDTVFMIQLGDIDGDGDLDVVAATVDGTANKYYLNDGDSDPFDSVGAGAVIGTDTHNSLAIELVDIDGDGDLDVITGHNADAPNKIYLNDGDSAPFNSVTSGIPIGTDTDVTNGIQVADVDGDGDMDVVAGNGNTYTCKFYPSLLYDTSSSTVASLEVDTEIANIPTAHLTATESNPALTWAEYWMSNNGGTQWFKVQSDKLFVFQTSGTDLRWKAELKTRSPVKTPSITQIDIKLTDSTIQTSTAALDVGENSTADFGVRLTSNPGVNWTIYVGYASGDADITVLSGAALTFTPSNWDTYQTVTLAAAEDDDFHSNSTVIRCVGVGMPDVDVTATEQDNDSPGFTITETGGSTFTSESGSTDTFSVVLDARPDSDVVILVSTEDVTEGSVDKASLTFTPADWDTAQTVTVTGVDDFLDDGTITYPVSVRVDDGNSDDFFDPLPDQSVSVDNTDDDVAGFTITESSGSTAVAETGTLDTFTVVLDAQPLSNVVITVVSEDTSECTVDTDTVTFTTANWNTPKTITVIGVDDDTDDDTVTAQIRLSVDDANSDDTYDPLADQTVSVENADDDTAGFTITPTLGLNTTEAGGTASFTVVLDSEPVSDVSIGISSSDTGEITVTPASLTFTSADWNTAQTITLTGVDDDMDDGNTAVTILTDAAVSADPKYNGLNPADVSASNSDNDTAGITVNPTAGLTTTEGGGTASFTVVLNTQPAANVTIAVSSSDTTEGTVSVSSLVFTATNWNDPQTVTITGEDEIVVDGSIAYTIQNADAVSADPLYNGMSVSDVSVTNMDNDTPSILAESDTVQVTEGAENTANVRLNTDPLGDTTVTVVRSSGDSDIQVSSGATLVFTSANWDTYQAVTFAAAEDDDAVNGSAVFRCSSSGLADLDITVTETDNDELQIMVSDNSISVPEAGDGTFSVRLTAAPVDSLAVSVSRSDGDSDVSVTDGASLTFDSSNWNTAQAVTVSAAEDDDAADLSAVITCSASGLDDVSVTATEQDNDTLEIVTDVSAVTVEESGTSIFNVRLTAQPLSDTMVTVSRQSGDTDINVSANATIPFTSENWNLWQSVTLFAGEDNDYFNESAVIRCSSTGLPVVDVVATELDNDILTILNNISTITNGFNCLFQADAGTPPYTWSVVNVTEGLQISIEPETGFCELQGTGTFQVRVGDSGPQTDLSQVITVKDDTQVTLSKHIPDCDVVEDYQTISMPLVTQNGLSQLTTSLGEYGIHYWRLFQYDPSGDRYIEYPDTPENIIPGSAFWIFTFKGKTVNLTGTQGPQSGTYPVKLKPGWNHIGNPFTQTLDWTAMTVTNGKNINSTPGSQTNELTLPGLYFFNNQTGDYEIGSTVDPFKGYWVKNVTDEDAFIVFDSSLTASKADALTIGTYFKNASQSRETPPAPPSAPTRSAPGHVDSGGGGGCFIRTLR